jgi:hypothetical protein
MERTAQCHCGSLRIIATGDPDRVYLCHCEACQRRTGTAFHFGATYPKERVRLEGERKVYERDADSGYRIRFHFCPNCGSTLSHRPSHRLATRSGRSQCIRGSACHREWSTIGRADRLSQIKRQ